LPLPGGAHATIAQNIPGGNINIITRITSPHPTHSENRSLLPVFPFHFSSIFPGGQLTPFAPMCGRPCRSPIIPRPVSMTPAHRFLTSRSTLSSARSRYHQHFVKCFANRKTAVPGLPFGVNRMTTFSRRDTILARDANECRATEYVA